MRETIHGLISMRAKRQSARGILFSEGWCNENEITVRHLAPAVSAVSTRDGGRGGEERERNSRQTLVSVPSESQRCGLVR